MKIIFLFISTVLIWGSTWIGIKYQLGKVDPMVSVFYRFFLSSILLILYCKLMKLAMRFSLKEHLYIALQGLLLFSISYWMVYKAEIYLTSGLIAVVLSSIIIMNIFNGALFIGMKIKPYVFLGALLGILGIVLIFRKELSSFTFSDKSFYGLVYALISTLIFSLGNILSARNQKHGLPVIQTNALGMAYGAFIILLFSGFSGKSVEFDFSSAYILSLLYLSIFGSIIAFGCYLTLLGKIGADRAAYGPLLVPVIALGISTVFEGYQWSSFAVIGLILIFAGNLMVLAKSRKKT